MDKKRKRASFTPPKAPTKKVPVREIQEEIQEPREPEKPAVKQVVEVVVENSRENRKSLGMEVDIIVPQNTEVRDETESEETEPEIETKEDVRKPQMVVEDVPEEETEQEDVQEEPLEHDGTITAVASPSTQEKEEETPREVVEVVGEETPKETEKPVSHFIHGIKKEHVDEQQETMEELFGKNSQTVMPEITVHRQPGTRGVVIWAVTMVAVAIGVGGGLVLFTNSKSQLPKTPIATASPTPPQPTVGAPTPTPTPATPTIARADLKVQVLNGGGVVGAGNKMKAALEDKGYTVTNVGNADAYTYDQTEIHVKASKADALPTLKSDLSPSYSIGNTDTKQPETSPYDVRVIVGKS